MINFRLEKGKFNYRIAGVLQRKGKILFHKVENDVNWSLPGGRAEMLEDSKETLVREFQEELNCEVEVQNLHFVVENFFEYRQLNYHEIGMIYRVALKEGQIPEEDFTVVENGVSFLFRWFDIDTLKSNNIHPAFLKEALSKDLPHEIQHIIQR